MEQLLVHILGDYILQSDWQALNKSKRTIPCLTHVLIYTSCFLILTTSWKALLVIGGVHFILDRWHGTIRRLIWAKNHLGPGLKGVPYEKCQATGYYDNVINTLRGEAEPETDGREGLKSLELLIAMYLSSRDGKRIALPLEY